MNLDEAWLKEMIELGKADAASALTRVDQSSLSPSEKLGVSMAIKGISKFEAEGESSRLPSTAQIARMTGTVLLDPLDAAYIRTWLAFSGGLGLVQDKRGVEAEDHEPEEKVRPPARGVQLPLTVYGAADEGPGDEDAQEVEQ